MMLIWEGIYFTSDKFRRDVIRVQILRDDLLETILAHLITIHNQPIQPAIFLCPLIILQLL